MKPILSILGLPIFKGQRLIGVKYAPNYFSNYNFYGMLNDNIQIRNTQICFERHNIYESLEFSKQVVKTYKERNYDFNLFIGGDHSMSMATISGMIDDENKDDHVVLWIDAHPDCNTFKTSPSMNLHGMSVSGILGLLPEPFDIFKCINKDQIMYLGIRSIDKGEKEFIRKNKDYSISNKLITADDFHEEPSLKLEEIESFIKNKKIHISFDVDSLDPKILSSTGTPVKNGFNIDQINEIFDLLSKHDVKSMDLVEFNPLLGNPNKSYNNVSHIVSSFLNKLLK
jgi:arginase